MDETHVNNTTIQPEGQESPILFTASCCAKVRELINEEENPALKLRVFIHGGGCSGFQYGFTFDEIVNEDDFLLEKDGLTFLVDPMSYQYLVGAEIEMINLPNREYKMKAVMEKIKDQYDFIIVDCSPSLGLKRINGFSPVRIVLLGSAMLIGTSPLNFSCLI